MCPGYTGGPLTCQLYLPNKESMKNETPKNTHRSNGRYLIGVQSLNFICNTDETPSFYTKLQYLKEWIDYTIQNN